MSLTINHRLPDRCRPPLRCRPSVPISHQPVYMQRHERRHQRRLVRDAIHSTRRRHGVGVLVQHHRGRLAHTISWWKYVCLATWRFWGGFEFHLGWGFWHFKREIIIALKAFSLSDTTHNTIVGSGNKNFFGERQSRDFFHRTARQGNGERRLKRKPELSCFND